MLGPLRGRAGQGRGRGAGPQEALLGSVRGSPGRGEEGRGSRGWRWWPCPHLTAPCTAENAPGRALGGADLVPGPWAAHEVGLAGRSLPPKGVQNPILFKLGDVLQGVPGAAAGGSRGHLLAGTVAHEARGRPRSPASASGGRQSPRRVTVACIQVRSPHGGLAGWGDALCDPHPGHPLLQGTGTPASFSGPGLGSLLVPPPAGPWPPHAALTSRVGSATPGWRGPGGTAGASTA